MTKEEIIKKLVTKDNFKTVVDICLKENIEISSVTNYLPDICIYYEQDELCETLYEVKLKNKRIKFRVGNEILSGVNNFFKHYKNISEFHIPGKKYIVIPNLIRKKHWFKESNYNEIGYIPHSLSSPAIESKDTKTYYINGDEISYKDWNISRRQLKLERILDIDI